MTEPVDLDTLIVTVTDVRNSNLCASGFKDWFTSVGLDDRFREFIKKGLPASVILGPGDAWGKAVVDSALKREGLDGQTGE